MYVRLFEDERQPLVLLSLPQTIVLDINVSSPRLAWLQLSWHWFVCMAELFLL